MGLIVALDAGGTRTDCLIGKTDGEILAKLAAGPANYHLVGIDGVTSTIRRLLREADKCLIHV